MRTLCVRRRARVALSVGVLATAAAVVVGPTGAARASPAYGQYRWPVRGPVVRPFVPPATPFSAGHRGIDIAAPFGTPIRAPAGGTVSFAGPVAGSLFISIDHPDGVRTSYSWVSAISVKKGQPVTAGEVVGRTGNGDPGSSQPVLHFSARFGGQYFDPMLLLGGADLTGLIHLVDIAA
jgi:murein DD-endopeptidase MepM/ murein hydrolase activator NlpD